jgi:hypothetical protein
MDLFASVSPNTVVIVRLLLQHGADSNGRTTGGGQIRVGTALSEASYRGNVDAVKALLEAGADPNLAASALKCALAQGRYVGRWKTNAADFGQRDAWTPLMLASILGVGDTVKLLLQKGADYNAQDAGAFTAIAIARARGFQNIVKAIAQIAIPKPGDAITLRADAICSPTDVDLDQVLQTVRNQGSKATIEGGFIVKMGTQVQIEEANIDSYKSRFRIVADGRECWTILDAVRR